LVGYSNFSTTGAGVKRFSGLEGSIGKTFRRNTQVLAAARIDPVAVEIAAMATHRNSGGDLPADFGVTPRPAPLRSHNRR
jgi:hypothetical protein